MDKLLPLCLFGAAALFALLHVFLEKRKPLWALLSVLCAIGGILTGLVSEMALEELLTPLLLLSAVSLLPLVMTGRGGEDEL